MRSGRQFYRRMGHACFAEGPGAVRGRIPANTCTRKALGQRPANAQLSKIGNIFSGSEVRKWMIDDGLLPIIQLIRQNIVFIRYDQWFNFLFHHCVLEIHSL